MAEPAYPGHVPEVHSITTAGRSHHEQSRERIRRYLITMGIRTACFAAAIFVQEGWARLLCVALAAILPIFAVLVANAGGDPRPRSAQYIDPSGLPATSQTDEPTTTTDSAADSARGRTER